MSALPFEIHADGSSGPHLQPDLTEAQRLLDAGFSLVRLHDYQKRPIGEDWNHRPARKIQADATGYGIPLAPNGLCSIDPDHMEMARAGLRACGFDLDELLAAGVRTGSTRPGSGGRSAFAADECEVMRWLALKVYDDEGKSVVVLELRAKSDNLQDCVPGVVYRDKASGHLCTQEYANGRKFDEAPALPEEFAREWRHMSIDDDALREFSAKFHQGIVEAGFKFNDKPPQHRPQMGSGQSLAFPAQGYRGPFNRRNTVESILEAHGYPYHRQEKRWSHPGATGGPGIRPIPGKDGLWRSDHAGDPLHGTFDAWAAYVQLDHEGDVEAAKASSGAESGDTADEDWPDLVALETAPPERLPVDQWPEVLRDYATDAAAETETPIELPALLALGVVAASAQRIANVQVKRGHVEPINLYIAVALPPATRKSREFKRATAPLVQWESRQREEIGKEMKAAESQIATHNELVKHRRKEAAKVEDDKTAQRLATELAELEENAPEMPRIPRVWTSDVTTEHLATMMSANDESLAVMSSEGGIFETMAGRYAQGVPNIDLYLQAHAGDAVRVDRGSKPPVLMDAPQLSIALAVQPDVLDKMSTKPGFQGRGLLGRFLYAVPPSGLGERHGNGPQMNGFTEMEYESRITGLLEAGQAAEDPSLIHLSAEAREVAQAFSKSVEQDLGHQGRFEHCPDWAGKLPGAVARIAALFHLARHGAGGAQSEVSVEDMKAAVDTGKALASHALAVYGAMGADPGIEDAKVILRWLRRHAWSEFTPRDVQQNHKSRFPRVRDMDPALEVLTERGYIRARTAQGGTPGRPSREFAVNPAAVW